MDHYWIKHFPERFVLHFGDTPDDAVKISIKFRIKAGGFDQYSSPHTYARVEQELAALGEAQSFIAIEQHESGPEILAYAVITLPFLTAVLNFATAVIKAASEGKKQGDNHAPEADLIIRGLTRTGEYRETMVMTIDWSRPPSDKTIKNEMSATFEQMFQEQEAKRTKKK